MDIEKANAKATERMMEARPVLVGLGKARDVIPGMRDNLLLHAGPPITWARASGPMRGAITGALIFEGEAKNEAEAKALYAGHVQEEVAPNGDRVTHLTYPKSWEVNNRWDRGMQTDYNGVKYESFPLVLMIDHEVCHIDLSFFAGNFEYLSGIYSASE